MQLSFSFFYTSILAIYMLIPLYRPIFVTHKYILPIYAIFVLAFMVFLLNINRLKEVNYKHFSYLLLYYGVSILSTLIINKDIRLDYFGLLSFLPLSYLLGFWFGKEGLLHWFFRLMMLVFAPIALYIVYQLSKSSFSYNTYYNWSSAAYKIDYLTASLYAECLLIYFYLKGRNFIEKYMLTVFCLAFILISGARYSIIYSFLVVGYLFFFSSRKSPIKFSLGIMVIFFSIITIILFDSTLVKSGSNLIDHSVFRLTNMLEDDSSVEGRLILIKKATQIISDHFFFGVGVAGSGDALDSVYPHNMLLEAFIDGGFFSTFPLFLFVVSSLFALYKSKGEHKIWCMLLVLYLFGGFLKSFSIYESRILFFFLGCAASLNVHRLVKK